MNSDTIVLFLSLLALFGQVALAGALIVLMGGKLTKAPRAALVQFCRDSALPVALFVAGVATTGSLYLSEGAHFVPCRLCWYQRIAMYPLAVILAVAVIRRRRDASVYVVPVASIGAAISIYHIAVERFPGLESNNICETANPCTLIWTDRFGFQTIPTMALTAFALIIAVTTIGAIRRPTHRSH
jgi:disulfide bond formation protein DsbB